MPWANPVAAAVAALAVDSSPASRRAFPARLTLVSSHLDVLFRVHVLILHDTEIDNLTDRAGMGDKYDDKINKFADGQINNQVPGGAGKSSGGPGGL
jgi:hypothetical protein